MTNRTKLDLQNQILKIESGITWHIENIAQLKIDIDNFEYECSESEYDEFLDEVSESVEVAGMAFYPSDILKSCDPIAYRCAKSDYESNYDLNDCEEYQDLLNELEEKESELSDLENELEELEDELSSLEDE